MFLNECFSTKKIVLEQTMRIATELNLLLLSASESSEKLTQRQSQSEINRNCHSDVHDVKPS
jgi:hypothetical protein